MRLKLTRQPAGNSRQPVVAIVFLLIIGCCISCCAKSIRPADTAHYRQSSEEWQFFRINAQYRGAVKQSFTNLGCAVVWFKDLTPDQIQVMAHVCALHPEKKGHKFAFRLNLVFRREECRYSVLSEIYGSFTGIEGERQNQLRQLLSLWAYMRQFTKNSRLCAELSACDAGVRLAEKIRRRGKIHEITCSWTSRRNFFGKFFFEQSTSGLKLDKLRFSSGKLSVSLVEDTQEAIMRDFAHRQPFNVDVFK